MSELFGGRNRFWGLGILKMVPLIQIAKTSPRMSEVREGGRGVGGVWQMSKVLEFLRIQTLPKLTDFA